jgi:hypothetical protein
MHAKGKRKLAGQKEENSRKTKQTGEDKKKSPSQGAVADTQRTMAIRKRPGNARN